MLLDVIQGRRSIRTYNNTKISDDDIHYILEAGRYAPSGGNAQPWLFGVIDDRELINELVKCCHNQKWIAAAPVVIALCTKRFSEDDVDMEKYRLGKLNDEIYNMDPNVLDILCAREHQTLLAADNMMLAAYERNIGSCLIAYFDVYKASKLLKVPNSHLVTYLLTLGHYDTIPAPKEVKPSEEIVFNNIYDK